MIEHVMNGDELIAIIIRRNFEKDGIEFFTPDSLSQQLAYMKHGKGHVIEPHVHNRVQREVSYTNEVLFLRSGRVRVDFFRNDQTYFESRILEKGDVILLASGGHGFEMLEPTEMIEVKQGPYAGEQDKTRFECIDPDCVVLKGQCR